VGGRNVHRPLVPAGAAARALIDQLAATVPDEASTRDFLQGVYNTFDLR
jgi:hypothetical protein